MNQDLLPSPGFSRLRRLRVIALAVLSAVLLAGVLIQWVLPYPKMILPLPATEAQDGHGWYVYLPGLSSSSLSYWQRRVYHVRPGDNTRQDVTLFEDGNPLPFPNSSLSDVFDIGGGRYSHWQSGIYFSTPRGDDPRINDRVYTAEVHTSPRMRVLAVTFFSGFGILLLALSFKFVIIVSFLQSTRLFQFRLVRRIWAWNAPGIKVQ